MYQSEIHGSESVFNLAMQTAEDGERVLRDRMEAAARAKAAAAYQTRMQRTLAECPGFIGADAPSCPGATGRVVVEPGDAATAAAWLKRRYAVNENLELSSDGGLCLEIRTRDRNKGVGSRRDKAHGRFGRPEQFELPL